MGRIGEGPDLVEDVVRAISGGLPRWSRSSMEPLQKDVRHSLTGITRSLNVVIPW
jgi:hypothetical protein